MTSNWSPGSDAYRSGVDVSSVGDESSGGDESSVGAPRDAMGRPLDRGLVGARNALLDALVTLDPQRASLVVIGAQAVHEHTRHLLLPPTATTDAEMAVDPDLVVTDPTLGSAMRAGGFELVNDARPGIWRLPLDGIQIDLLVPEALAGAGNRGARLPNHAKHDVGRAAGLELAILDNATVTIDSLDGSRPPSRPVKLASAAALLCVKAFKLTDRINDFERNGRDRRKPKDAHDVYLLTQAADPRQARAVFERGIAHPRMGTTIADGLDRLVRLFEPEGAGIRLAIRAQNDRPSDTINRDFADWFQAFRR